ncbi:uncharacterized protein LOC111086274 [Limulus polyphemus]|uniref:Uncharacterized protein LOC111086274 n=1 Tax=Limulus polyphemus TaxID=6850 RepID=A0ABM1SKQ7_LIMPO|nr:uncharacterized protein LOC111086274 [Limulus polyphemus]
MKLLLVIISTISLGAISYGKDIGVCKCIGYVIDKDGLDEEDRIEADSEEFMSVTCDKEGIEECKLFCMEVIPQATRDLDLDFQPEGLAVTLGQFICELLETRKFSGYRTALFASACGKEIDTGLRSKETLCCDYGKRC